MKLLSSHLLVTVMLCVCVCLYDKGATAETKSNTGKADGAGFPSPKGSLWPLSKKYDMNDNLFHLAVHFINSFIIFFFF